MELNRIQNLLLANAPPNVQAQAQTGEEALRQAMAPSAPYNSRAAGLVKALEGGLGGLMQGAAVQQAMQGRQDAAKAGYGWLSSLQQGGGAAPGGGMSAPAGPGAGTIPGSAPIRASGSFDPNGINWDRGGPQNDAKRATLMNYAVSNLGLSPTSAAALIGHADAESNFRPGVFNPTGERSHGLFQWNEDAGRWSPFVQWAQANGRSSTDPYAQLDYAKVEASRMKGANGQSVWDNLANAPDLASASRSWMDGFEQPKVRDYGNRINLGNAALRAYQTAGGTAPSGSAQPQTASADKPAPNAQPVASGTLPPGITPDMVSAPPASDGTVRGDLEAAFAQHGGLDPDAPAPNATPTGMAGLPPGVTPAMWAASQNAASDGNALRRGDEMPAGTAGPVMRSGAPHQLGPGADARADNGAALGLGSDMSRLPKGAPPTDTSTEPDPEGTGPQNYDPNAGPSLRDTLEAAFKGPDLGQAQPAVVPPPAPLGPGDQVGPGGLVAQPAGPSSLPGPLPGQGGTAGAQPSPVAPASDGSVRGDLLAAAAQHGMDVSGAPVMPPPQGDLTAPPAAPAPDPVAAGQMAGRDVALDPVVPDPTGSLVPPAPSSPNGALQGPQSDAAAGNGSDDLRAMLTAQVMGSGAGTTGPQSDAAMGGASLGGPGTPAAPQGSLPDTPPLPPPGAQTLQASADMPAPGPGAAPNRLAAADVGDPGLDAMRAGMVAQGPAGGTPPATSSATAPPAIGSAAPPAMGALSAPPPSGTPGQGGPSNSDLSKLAVGPLTPSYMSGLASALSTPAQPAAAPHPMALADALDGSKPAPNAVPAGPQPMAPSAAPMQPVPPAPQFGGSGTNAPAGNSPTVDPSSALNGMRADMARGQGGAQSGGLMGSLQGLFSPGSTTDGGSAQQTRANPSASPAAQSMAGQVMAATGGQGGSGQATGAASGYISPAMAPAPSGGAAAPAAPSSSFGGLTPEQRQAGLALVTGPNAMYLDPAVKEAITARLFAQPKYETLQNGDLYRLDPTGASAPQLVAHGGKFGATKNGIIYNEGTGLGVNGQPLGGASSYRPMTPAELKSYGITDGRPAYIGPGGEPHFGMPEAQGQGETEEAKESGKAAAGRQNDMLNAANAAPMKIARLDLIGNVLDKTRTGPLAGEMGTAAAIASQAGISPERLAALGIDPNQAVNNAIANKLAGEMTMSSIGAKNGGMPASNFSVAERQFIEALYPNIENMPGANRMVIDVLKTAEQRNAQIAQEWGDYKDQQRGAGKPLSYGDFEDNFRRAHARDNVFAPIIAKYQAGGYTPNAPSPGGMPSAASAGAGQGGGQGAPSMAPQPAAPTPQPGGQGAPGGGAPAQGGGQAPQPQAGKAGQRAGTPAPADAIAQAQAAIARGAPRAAVIQRLQGMGINTAGL